jgi:hypothetical protein
VLALALAPVFRFAVHLGFSGGSFCGFATYGGRRRDPFLWSGIVEHGWNPKLMFHRLECTFHMAQRAVHYLFDLFSF